MNFTMLLIYFGIVIVVVIGSLSACLYFSFEIRAWLWRHSRRGRDVCSRFIPDTRSSAFKRFRLQGHSKYEAAQQERSASMLAEQQWHEQPHAHYPEMPPMQMR